MSGVYVNKKTGKKKNLKETLLVNVWDEDLDFSDDYDGIISWLLDTDNEPMCYLDKNENGVFSVVKDYETKYQDTWTPSVEELQELCDALKDRKSTRLNSSH